MATNNNRSSNGSSNRGFASMDENRQREIASMGGKAAHQKGTAHEFDSAEAAEAGRKGGKASHSSGNRSNNNANSNTNRSRNSQGEFGSGSDYDR